MKIPQFSLTLRARLLLSFVAVVVAVEAIKPGAYDYLPKPFTPEALTALSPA